MPATAEAFVSIHPVGGLLPMDMLRRIADGRDVSASKPSDYHIVGARTSVKDAAERRWGYLKGAWRALRDSVGDGGDPTGLAIEDWLLPLFDEHGFGRLPALPADLTKAQLKRADLARADLRQAILVGANLSRANFTGAILKGVDVTDAVRDGVRGLDVI